MRHLLLIAAGLSLAAAPVAIAAPHHHTPPGLAKKPYGLPPGQAKKMWRRGEHLPRTYVVERYVVVEPQRYRLASPPPGYRWVGVNGDAYLVQTETGLIRDVIASLLN